MKTSACSPFRRTSPIRGGAEAAVKACVAELGAPGACGYLRRGSPFRATSRICRSMRSSAAWRSITSDRSTFVRAILPAMRKRGSGRIVLVFVGRRAQGLFGYATYSPTKFALRGLAEESACRSQGATSASRSSIRRTPKPRCWSRENKIKPEETKLITGLVKPWSAQAVADCIMRGIKTGKFAITPGLDDHAYEQNAGDHAAVASLVCRSPCAERAPEASVARKKAGGRFRPLS